MPLDELIPILLLQVALVLGVSRLVGQVFARFHQPQVVGEMLAGIILGPSLLGWLSRAALTHGWAARDYWGMLFPAASIPYLGVLSQIGVIFFLFLVGLELDPKLLRNRGGVALVISHVSIVAPFLLGAALTIYLYPRLFNETPRSPFVSVALFMGAAMSITAFPVLARILTERNLQKTKVGAIAITCAAVDDVTAWCMLAFVVAVARSAGLKPALWTAGLSVAYVLAMFFIVRPFLSRLQRVYDRQGRLSQNVLALIVLLTLLSACATERIGIHALFGAFLMGAVMPKGTNFVRTVSGKMEDYIVVFLLPIFFAYTGLRTQIGLLNSAEMWGYTALIVLVACAGKFGGSTLAGRLCGLGWRESSTIGILMNTRGLMELVILNIGKDLGVITPAVFAMMVLMALITTGMTTPVLQLVFPKRLYDPNLAPDDPAAGSARRKSTESAISVLLSVADPRTGGPLLRLAAMIAGPSTAHRPIYALHLTAPEDRDAYRAGLDEPAPELPQAAGASLEPLLEEARHAGLEVVPITFASRDVPGAIAAVARLREVEMILMGFHRPVLGKNILGGTVNRVLAAAPADVGVFVDRGFAGGRRVLVPYLGGPHDRLALELAARLGRNAESDVTILHVAPPGQKNSPTSATVSAEISRMFHNPSAPVPVQFRAVEHESPVEAVLAAAGGAGGQGGFDLIVIGVAEEWGTESHRFGLRTERIAEGSACSLLLVHKHPQTGTPPQPDGQAIQENGLLPQTQVAPSEPSRQARH